MSRDRLLTYGGRERPETGLPDSPPAPAGPRLDALAAVSGRVEVDRIQFSVQSRLDGSTLLLSLAGEFNWAATEDVEGALQKAWDLPIEHVVFDLSALTSIDITGLKVILKAHEGAPARGLQITVVRPRGLANRIFTLTRAAETLEIVDSV